jgi:hypothetical protein
MKMKIKNKPPGGSDSFLSKLQQENKGGGNGKKEI